MKLEFNVVRMDNEDVIATSGLRFLVSGAGDGIQNNFSLKLDGTGSDVYIDYKDYKLHVADKSKQVGGVQGHDASVEGAFTSSEEPDWAAYNGWYTFDGTKFIHD